MIRYRRHHARISYNPYTNNDQNTNCRRPRARAPRCAAASRPTDRPTARGAWIRRCVTARRDTARPRERARVVRSLSSIAAFVRLVVGSVRDRARERGSGSRERESERARMAEEDARGRPRKRKSRWDAVDDGGGDASGVAPAPRFGTGVSAGGGGIALPDGGDSGAPGVQGSGGGERGADAAHGRSGDGEAIRQVSGRVAAVDDA